MLNDRYKKVVDGHLDLLMDFFLFYLGLVVGVGLDAFLLAVFNRAAA